MPATVSTTEHFPKEVTPASIDEAERLRIKAGAVTSTPTHNPDGNWTIVTVWNVIGEK